MLDITHDTEDDLVVMDEANRHRIDRYLLQKIGSAIQWIDDPGVLGCMLSDGFFFCNEASNGDDFAKTLYEYFFSGFIYVTHQAVS